MTKIWHSISGNHSRGTMKHISELHNILEQYFNWNKSRLNVLVNLLICLFTTRTVNLSEHAVGLCSKAKIESNYKRLQRFFRWIISSIDCKNATLNLVINVLNLKNRKNDLALDRTDWKFGRKHINILVLDVNFKRVCIPLVWISLGKADNAKTPERIELLEKIIREIPINSFTADREFIGEKWFKYLISTKISFFIRIKENTQVLKKRGNYTVRLKDLFKNLERNKRKFLKERYVILGVEVGLAASRNYKGELLIVITNKCSRLALKMYKKRWAIETLFCYLKTKGFCFEDTHMIDMKKVEAWMLILTLAVVWTLKARELVQPQLKVGSHGRKRKSLFKCCFEAIRKCLLCPHIHIKILEEFISLFTKKPSRYCLSYV